MIPDSCIAICYSYTSVFCIGCCVLRRSFYPEAWIVPTGGLNHHISDVFGNLTHLDLLEIPASSSLSEIIYVLSQGNCSHPLTTAKDNAIGSHPNPRDSIIFSTPPVIWYQIIDYVYVRLERDEV